MLGVSRGEGRLGCRTFGDIHSDRHGAIHGHFVLLAVLDDHRGAIAELDGLWTIAARDTDQNIAGRHRGR